MAFRVTNALTSAFTKQNLARTSSRRFEAEQRVSDGKRISRPSDDPGQIARLLALKRNSSEIEQYGVNVAESKAIVSSANSALEKISDLIADAQEQTVAGLNGASTDRSAVASALRGILDQVVALANAKLGDRYLFGGTITDRPPFVVDTDPSGQFRVTYQGNDDVFQSEVGPGLVSNISVPGSNIFAGTGRTATSFVGPTGAAPGTGDDSGNAVDRLIVAHGITTYAGGGLTAGSSSATRDTVIGAAGTHTVALTVDATGSTGTIALNNGTAVSFTNPETNLAVTGPNGEVIYVNTSTVTPGFNGQVALTATGTLSIDGGQSSVAVNFSNNQQVFDAHNGSVLNVDSTGITRAGTEDVSYGGTLDLFSSLSALANSFSALATASDPTAARAAAEGYFDELKSSHNTLLRALSDLGTREARLDAAEDRIGDLDVRIKELTSTVEEVDFSEAIIDYRSADTTYQSALAIAARVNQLSLLDFL